MFSLPSRCSKFRYLYAQEHANKNFHTQHFQEEYTWVNSLTL